MFYDEVKTAIQRQRGLSILIDALAGDEFAEEIDYEWLSKDTGEPETVIRQAFHAAQLKARAREQPPVLVGHNISWDLAYLYNTFIHPTHPSSFAEFKSEIHRLFPRVVDTKIALQKCTIPAVADNNLEVTAHILDKHVQAPHLVWETGYGYKEGSGKAHDAGFDCTSLSYPSYYITDCFGLFF